MLHFHIRKFSIRPPISVPSRPFTIRNSYMQLFLCSYCTINIERIINRPLKLFNIELRQMPEPIEVEPTTFGCRRRL